MVEICADHKTMGNSFYRFFCVVIGGAMTLFAFLGVGVGILAMLEPVGTKMADDSDPLGTPPNLTESLLLTLLYALIGAFGIWLVMRAFRVRK
jgi:hypothetical protein